MERGNGLREEGKLLTDAFAGCGEGDTPREPGGDVPGLRNKTCQKKKKMKVKR